MPDGKSMCGCQFEVREGRQKQDTKRKMQYQHTCPKCNTKIPSAVADGRVGRGHKTSDGKHVCGFQFEVREGQLKKSTKLNREYQYACPRCKAKILSSVVTGCVGRDHKKPDHKTMCGFQFQVHGGEQTTKKQTADKKGFERPSSSLAEGGDSC